MVEVIVIVDCPLVDIFNVQRDRDSFKRRMREVYTQIRNQYVHKGKSIKDSETIARKVVFKIAKRNGFRITQAELEAEE